ncbi:MAG: DUF547 domain-containing protein [bacterium]|nr:DUF547 domain-containing protein [bacterium]
MKRGHTIFTVALIVGLTIVSVSLSRAEDVVDHSLFSELLQNYVKDGLVNYKEMKNEEQKLDRYLDLLNNTNPDKLGRDEQFAFFMNAYNAYTIKLILENYPVKSIKDTGSLLKSPWKINFAKIGGQTMTLDDVEHKILRPRFKDARVHFAINCAAQDCPPLYPDAFEGAKVDEQLERNARAFLNNPEKNYLDGNTLYVTRLFKWFGGDFNDDPFGYVLQFAEGEFKAQLEAKKDKIKVKFLGYDWTLNGG